MKQRLSLSAAALLLSISRIEAFVPPEGLCTRCEQSPSQQNRFAIFSHRDEEEGSTGQPTRRSVLQSTAISLATIASSTSQTAQASLLNPFAQPEPQAFTPSKRCTAYLVDSTIPPSLIPYRAQREAAILKNLGMGGGTSKEPFLQDELNLNNFMNKAVFGVIDSVSGAVSGSGSENKGAASFVFLGANFDSTSPTALGDVDADGELAVSLMKDMCRPREREGNTAVGLAFAPVGAQDALDEYVKSSGDGGAMEKVMKALKAAGADEYLMERHVPILQFARSKSFPLLALSPDSADLKTLQKGGLQSLDPARRDMYVADAEGFIDLTRDPKFKLYTDKSLIKDFKPSSETIPEDQIKAEQANYFAEKILVHEAAATKVAQWAASRPNSLVITVASIPDVRFMGGMNGRVPRVYNKLNDKVEISEDAVTTILLNPSAKETLSQNKWLRLEIGTAPDNWAYQTKVADYFWFSSMPKVNMLPRMMNEQ